MVATIDRIPARVSPQVLSGQVTLAEWILLRGVWLGCLPPRRLILEAKNTLPPGIGLIGVSETRLHEALEHCLIRGWLILVDDDYIETRRGLLSNEPLAPGLPRKGDVEITADGEKVYHQLTRNLFWGKALSH